MLRESLMAKFSVSVWMEIEADNHEEAYEIASVIEKQIMEFVDYVEDVGQIDVECTEEE